MSRWRMLTLILLCVGTWSVATRGSAQTSQMPDWTLSDDHMHVVGKFSRKPPVAMSLDVGQVEYMMSRLAELRASMVPPRPMTDPAPGSVVIVPEAGRWFVQRDPGKPQNIILMILHPGYGWVPLRLGPAETKNFVDALRGFAPKP
jgi:hypothetical protein